MPGKPKALRRGILDVFLIFMISSLVTGVIPLRIPAEEMPAIAGPKTENAGGDRPTVILFKGNTAVSEGELRKSAEEELSAFQNLGNRRADIDDAAYQMAQVYRKKGYAFASVEYRLEKSPTGILVTFEILEGPRVVLADVKFTGNKLFNYEELGAFFGKGKRDVISLGIGVLTFWVDVLGGEGGTFVESEISAAVDAIRSLYVSRGYLDVEVQKPGIVFSEDRTRADVTLSINEGKPYVVQKVDFTGDVTGPAEDQLKALAGKLQGEPYFNRRKLVLRSRVVEIYSNLGYPDVQVDVRTVPTDVAEQVSLEAHIISGPRVKITSVSITGNEKTKEFYIRRRVALRPGDWYTLEGERESFRELYRTGLFSKVGIQLDKSTAEEARELQINVEDAPSKEFSLEAGWGSYEMLRGRVGFQEKNLFGSGRVAGTEIGASLKGENISAILTEPMLFGTRISASLPLSYRRRVEPSFTREEVGLSLLFSRPLSEVMTATLGYSYFVNSLTDLSAEASPEDLDENYNLASLKSQVTLDTRDDIFFPTRGLKGSLSGEVADPLLGGDLSMLRLTGGVRLFFPLFRSTVLGLRYQSGFIYPTGDQVSIPLGEKFFNGGENTVRSFRESGLGPLDTEGDPLGGLAYNVFSVELRRMLTERTAATLFFDYGNVSPNFSEAEQGKAPFQEQSEVISATLDDFFKDFRPAVGAGVQYLLPVGPARIDVAVNPSPREERGEDRFVIHFSVGMAF